MKKVIFLMIAIILISSTGYAEQLTTNKVYGHKHTLSTPEDQDTTTEAFGGGVGVDLVLLKTSSPYLTEIVSENRYDIANDEFRTFAVAKVDLFDIIKNR